MPKKEKEQAVDEYSSTVLDLLRKILKGVQLSEINFDKSLTGQDKIEFLKFCDYVYTNPNFEKIISNIFYPSLMYAAQKAENYEEVSFNRATANGAALVREYFRSRSSEYQTKFLEKDDKPSEGHLFEPVGPPKY